MEKKYLFKTEPGPAPGLGAARSKAPERQSQLPRFTSSSTVRRWSEKMDKQNNNIDETATMCATKAGNGFKVVVNGVWFYASKRQVLEMIEGRVRACTFHTIKDEPIVGA
jgi:hypothetical protein